VRDVSRLWEFYTGICLIIEEEARKNLSQDKKNLSQVKKTSVKVQYTYYQKHPLTYLLHGAESFLRS